MYFVGVIGGVGDHTEARGARIHLDKDDLSDASSDDEELEEYADIA